MLSLLSTFSQNENRAVRGEDQKIMLFTERVTLDLITI